MDELFTQLAIGVLVPLLAFIFKLVIDRFTRNRKRRFEARFSHSNVQSVLVDADASEDRIADRVREAFQLERLVLHALTAYANKQPAVETHSGRRVDFVLEQDGKKIAIEAKLDTEQLSIDLLERYLSSEEGLSAVILVSPRPAPERLVRSARKLIDSGRVQFVTLTNPLAFPTQLESSLTSALLKINGRGD